MKSRRGKIMTNDICGNEFQPSLRDSFVPRAQPGVETPGYCRAVPAGTKITQRQPVVNRLISTMGAILIH